MRQNGAPGGHFDLVAAQAVDAEQLHDGVDASVARPEVVRREFAGAQRLVHRITPMPSAVVLLEVGGPILGARQDLGRPGFQRHRLRVVEEHGPVGTVAAVVGAVVPRQVAVLVEALVVGGRLVNEMVGMEHEVLAKDAGQGALHRARIQEALQRRDPRAQVVADDLQMVRVAADGASLVVDLAGRPVQRVMEPVVEFGRREHHEPVAQVLGHLLVVEQGKFAHGNA